jgi:hypothetical protein
MANENPCFDIFDTKKTAYRPEKPEWIRKSGLRREVEQKP